jgi:Arc/MetJ-type ribon-helix-helix transcriptional regulator
MEAALKPRILDSLYPLRKKRFDSKKRGFYTAFIGARYMTIKLTPKQEQAIQKAIANGVVRSVAEFIDTAIALLPQGKDQTNGSRLDAVRAMEEFGEKYRLSLGEPITRKLFHEGCR